eukprot:RCo019608
MRRARALALVAWTALLSMGAVYRAEVWLSSSSADKGIQTTIVKPVDAGAQGTSSDCNVASVMELRAPITSGPTSADRITWPPFVKHYYGIYRAMIIDRTIPAKFVVFRGDSTGWGN